MPEYVVTAEGSTSTRVSVKVVDGRVARHVATVLRDDHARTIRWFVHIGVSDGDRAVLLADAGRWARTGQEPSWWRWWPSRCGPHMRQAGYVIWVDEDPDLFAEVGTVLDGVLV